MANKQNTGQTLCEKVELITRPRQKTHVEIRQLISARFDACADVPTLEVKCGKTTKFFVDVDIKKACEIIEMFERLRTAPETWTSMVGNDSDDEVCKALLEFVSDRLNYSTIVNARIYKTVLETFN